jgi:hypothetical protein
VNLEQMARPAEPVDLEELVELEGRFQEMVDSEALAEPEVWAESAAREQTELMEHWLVRMEEPAGMGETERLAVLEDWAELAVWPWALAPMELQAMVAQAELAERLEVQAMAEMVRQEMQPHLMVETAEMEGMWDRPVWVALEGMERLLEPTESMARQQPVAEMEGMAAQDFQQ